MGMCALSRLTVRQPGFACSEMAIESIAARPDSPAWLEAEYAATRAGLIQLRQNVVLLRHADSPDLFYPVRTPDLFYSSARHSAATFAAALCSARCVWHARPALLALVIC